MILPTWLTGIGAKIAAIALAIFAILAELLKFESSAKKAGAAEQAEKSSEATIKNVETGNAAEQKVEQSSDAELDKLREKWTKDGDTK